MEAGKGTERARVLIALTTIQILFGIHYLAGKIVLREIPPRAWALLRVAGSAVLLVALARLMRRRFPLDRKDLALLAVFSLFGVSINQVCFVEGLARTTAIHSAIINTLIPAWTLVFAVLLGREEMTVMKAASLVLACAGVLLVIRPERATLTSATFVGDLLTMINSMSYSFFLVVSKRTMHRVDALAATALMFVFGTIPIAAFGASALARTDLAAVSAAAWWWGAFIVAFPTAAAYVLISWTLARAEASLVALFVYLQPVIATILGIAVAGEHLTLRTVAGALLIFAGVYLALNLPRPPGLRRAAPAS
ncbi:MAG TPA: DMT family transporter [Candidatus Polarisedimenticolaceae bacterium]|nr:DMT family transporter [Candidatus Polarisedimenticolaceae bacterium]